MAIETTWRIALTEYTNDENKGVLTAHWRVTAQDGDYTASAYGTAGFTPDPDAEGFIPYADLTEADVLAWVWGSVDKDEIEANLAKQIEDQKAPATQSGLPWA
jgi:hypothetical protein